MKITVQNLGAIREAQVEIKPLTIFIGPNSTGKTWLAYTLAALFDSSGINAYLDSINFEEVLDKYSPLAEAVQQTIEHGNAKLDILSFAENYGDVYFNQVFNKVRGWIASALGTRKTNFETLEIYMELAEAKSRFLENVKAFPLERKLSPDRKTRQALLNIVKEKNEPIVYLFTETLFVESLSDEILKSYIIRNIFQVFHRSLFPQIYVLPTERTTLISAIFPMVQPLPPAARLVNKKRLEPSDDETASIYDTYSMYKLLRLLLGVVRVDNEDRKITAQSNPLIQEYIALANLLETRILDGEVKISKPNAENLDKLNILFQQSEDLSFEMTVCSSMVKELTPLVLYLRYVAEPGDLLIIDEPEMNLHPLAQARLIELLAIMVNFGLNVIVTTHSPYLIDHLTNLIKAANNNNPEEISDKFFLGKKEAFIYKNKLSIQLFEGGTIHNILKENGLIDWGSFGKISERISEIYFEI
jgi:energy-coupling factor transporter ATP-binding protein EcfA2